MNNPFTVIFGVQPKSLIPRTNDLSKIVSVFEDESPRTYAYVITGVRGCGKTVLLTSVQRYFKEKEEWIVLRLNPDIDLYESAISQLDGYITFTKELISEVSISVAGFGGGLSKRSVSNNETLLKKMLEMANQKGKRVLIAIDEASNTDNLKTFAHSYQAFLGEGIQVYLLMTALPENFLSLAKSKNGTFLRRLPRVSLGKLSDITISNKYAEIFDISMEESNSLANFVKGYSFAYQVLGDILWESNKNKIDEYVIREFDMVLDDCVYTPIWEHLSELEKEVLYATANSDNTVKNIRELMGMDSNKFSPYREILGDMGLIDTNTYGKIYFTLPRFSQYVQYKKNFEQM